MKIQRPSQCKSTRRPDGMATYNTILETAGQMFGSRGFDEVTSKEIAEKAGTNNAAINYYFGSKEKLYEEVLIAAHNQIMSMEQLEDIISTTMRAEEKLRVVLQYFLRVADNSSELWGIRLLLRALAFPSHKGVERISEIILPKTQVLLSLIQEITGLPKDSEQLHRAVAFVILPLISYILVPETFRKTLPPLRALNSEETLEDLLTYCMQGLHALSLSKK